MPRQNDSISGDGHTDAGERDGDEGLSQWLDRRLGQIHVPDGIRTGTICQVCKIAAVVNPSDIYWILSNAIRDERSRHAVGDVDHPYFASDTKLRFNKSNLER